MPKDKPYTRIEHRKVVIDYAINIPEMTAPQDEPLQGERFDKAVERAMRKLLNRERVT